MEESLDLSLDRILNEWIDEYIYSFMTNKVYIVLLHSLHDTLCCHAVHITQKLHGLQQHWDED